MADLNPSLEIFDALAEKFFALGSKLFGFKSRFGPCTELLNGGVDIIADLENQKGHSCLADGHKDGGTCRNPFCVH